MPDHPTVDELFEDLRRAGWRMAENAVADGWRVSGTAGGITLRADGLSREEAWKRAWEQAQAAPDQDHAAGALPAASSTACLRWCSWRRSAASSTSGGWTGGGSGCGSSQAP